MLSTSPTVLAQFRQALPPDETPSTIPQRPIGADATIDAFNYIKISPIAVTTGSTVQAGFNEAMGPLGSIVVSGPAFVTHEYLTSFYDTNTAEAVIGTVHSNPGLFAGSITEGDHVNVIGLVHMSAATYAGFTPHFA